MHRFEYEMDKFAKEDMLKLLSPELKKRIQLTVTGQVLRRQKGQWFATLGDEYVAKICEVVSTQYFAPQEYLFKQEDDADASYVIVKGSTLQISIDGLEAMVEARQEAARGKLELGVVAAPGAKRGSAFGLAGTRALSRSNSRLLRAMSASIGTKARAVGAGDGRTNWEKRWPGDVLEEYALFVEDQCYGLSAMATDFSECLVVRREVLLACVETKEEFWREYCEQCLRIRTRRSLAKAMIELLWFADGVFSEREAEVARLAYDSPEKHTLLEEAVRQNHLDGASVLLWYFGLRDMPMRALNALEELHDAFDRPMYEDPEYNELTWEKLQETLPLDRCLKTALLPMDQVRAWPTGAVDMVQLLLLAKANPLEGIGKVNMRLVYALSCADMEHVVEDHRLGSAHDVLADVCPYSMVKCYAPIIPEDWFGPDEEPCIPDLIAHHLVSEGEGDSVMDHALDLIKQRVVNVDLCQTYLAMESRWALVHHGCHRGQLDLVMALVDSRADVNLRVPPYTYHTERVGQTPLHLLAASQHEHSAAIMDVLMAAGATVSPVDASGRTPLDLAEQHNPLIAAKIRALDLYTAFQSGVLESVKAAIDYGADPNVVSPKTGTTPLTQAVMRCRGPESDGGNARAVINLLLAHKAATAAVTRLGQHQQYGPLFAACYNGLREVVGQLLKHHCDVNAAGPDGKTPLHVAARRSHLDIAKDLVAAKAEVDVVDSSGQSPLTVAATWSQLDDAEVSPMVAFLAACGAEPMVGEAVAHAALRRGNTGHALAVLRQIRKLWRDGWEELVEYRTSTVPPLCIQVSRRPLLTLEDEGAVEAIVDYLVESEANLAVVWNEECVFSSFIRRAAAWHAAEAVLGEGVGTPSGGAPSAVALRIVERFAEEQVVVQGSHALIALAKLAPAVWTVPDKVARTLVDLLYDSEVCLDLVPEGGVPALYLAVDGGQWGVANAIVQQAATNESETLGASLSYQHPNTGDAVLHLVARAGNADFARRLLGLVADRVPDLDLQAMNAKGQTAEDIAIATEDQQLLLTFAGSGPAPPPPPGAPGVGRSGLLQGLNQTIQSSLPGTTQGLRRHSAAAFSRPGPEANRRLSRLFVG
mmetsp:Transcript_97023/g.222298  ORF Transcript_97023/g.222298 Transcript_97023/m.222298 type:complete len:1101 (-) Transcript_97023:5-3307(-)